MEEQNNDIPNMNDSEMEPIESVMESNEVDLNEIALKCEDDSTRNQSSPKKEEEKEEPEAATFKLLGVSSAKQFDRENFLKGCKWAPDGTCLVTSSNDAVLRIFDLTADILDPNGENNPKELISSLKIEEPEIIYDFAWYPFMNSSNPDTACLFATSKDNPVHLIDAYTGQVRCSYKGYNHVDELVNAYSIAFNSDASKIYCGYNKTIKIFDISIPGRNYKEVRLDSEEFKITGMVSCIGFSSQPSGAYAVGSYSKHVGIYVEETNRPVCIMQSHTGGVTHLCFSPDGQKLFSGGRKDPDIFCWDIRNPGKLLQVFKRDVETNQRIYFDLQMSVNATTTSEAGQQQVDCKYLASGNHDGSVRIWRADEFDLSVESEPMRASFQAHQDCTNGISFHPGHNLLATSSGQRRIFPKTLTSTKTKTKPSVTRDESSKSDSSDEDDEAETMITYENTLKIWMHNLK